MCLHNRTKFIMFQIAILALLDFLSIFMFYFHSLIYCAFLIIIADAPLIKKLGNLY